MMEYSSRHALEVLRSTGFTAEVIEPGPEPTADIRAVDFAGQEYLVEAKFRDVAPSSRALEEELDRRGVATLVRTTEIQNAVSKSLLEAAAQLEATGGDETTFRIIWVVADHPDESFVLECVKIRLLGEAQVIVNPHHGIVKTRRCFFYEHNDFSRLPRIAGAVLSAQSGQLLLANPIFERADAFRKSVLYRLCNGRNACCDPFALEQSGDAFIIGPNCNWKRPNPQWNYLKEKYGALTSKMMESSFNGVVSVRITDG
jgi:hypothetical protein